MSRMVDDIENRIAEVEDEMMILRERREYLCDLLRSALKEADEAEHGRVSLDISLGRYDKNELTYAHDEDEA
jgi:hypothetical protein